jgi:hypothetical protein
MALRAMRFFLITKSTVLKSIFYRNKMPFYVLYIIETISDEDGTKNRQNKRNVFQYSKQHI